MLSSDVENQVKEAIEAAGSVQKPKLLDDMLITYSYDSLPAARALYISLISSGARVALASHTEASTLIIPYRDVGEVVVMSVSSKDSRAIRVAEEAAMMGTLTYFVAPPMDETLEARLSRHDNLERLVVSPRAPLLTMMAAATLWSSDLKGPRGTRLRAEVADINNSITWVLSRYGKEIGEASRLSNFTALYGPSLAPGSLYLCRVCADRCRDTISMDEPDRLSKVGDALVQMISTVEEHDYMDVELEIRLRRLSRVKLEFNVDPITANLYAAIAASLIGGRTA